MGYSGRYHAASLAAVFVALAIGILIGVGLADDVVSGASQEIEDTLRSDLDDSEAEVDSLTGQLDLQRQFSEIAGPALVSDRLDRDRVAIVELGEVGSETTDPAIEAIEAAGGELTSVSILALPPDVEGIAGAAEGRFADRRAGPELGSALGVAIGRQLVGGGPLIERVRERLFTRFTGSLEGVSRVVFVSQAPDELEAALTGAGRAFETALLRGIDSRALGTVAVEHAATDPTTLEVFSSAGIPTVDNVDQGPGRVATVFALLGAEGEFGVKNAATSLLPDLLPDQADPAP